MYDDFRVIGIYLSSADGRYRIHLQHKITKIKKSMSYPKYLVECYIDEFLTEEETVDHIDGNPLNNNIANLQILGRKSHSLKDSIKVQPEDFICPMCDNIFSLEGKKLNSARHRRKSGHSGPFCSKSCAGKYGALISHKKIEKINQEFNTFPEPKYYK